MSLLYPDLGSICFAPGCDAYDMLAAKCGLCGAVTCTEHARPESHACEKVREGEVLCTHCGRPVRLPGGRNGEAACAEALAAHRESDCIASSPRRASGEAPITCAVNRCVSADAATIITCSECGQTVCLGHRHSDQHPCIAHAVRATATARLNEPMTAEEAALPFHRWKYANSPDSVDTGAIPVELRVGLRVFFAPQLLARPRYICVSRAWSVGKVLDAACSAAAVPNTNHMVAEPEKRLNVFLLWGSCPLLSLSDTLSGLMGGGGGGGAGVSGCRPGCGVYIQPGLAIPRCVVSSVPRWVISLHLRSLAGDGAGKLQEHVTRRTWLERLDDGPSLYTRCIRSALRVPRDLALLAAYVAVLLVVGFLDLT